MATLNIENVPNPLYNRLQELAKQNHLSLDNQVIDLLEKAISPETEQNLAENSKESILKLIEESSKRRRVNPVDFGLPDSTELIREDRAR